MKKGEVKRKLAEYIKHIPYGVAMMNAPVARDIGEKRDAVQTAFDSLHRDGVVDKVSRGGNGARKESRWYRSGGTGFEAFITRPAINFCKEQFRSRVLG